MRKTGVILTVALLAAIVTLLRSRSDQPDRDHAVAQALMQRGLVADTKSTLWLDAPPYPGVTPRTVPVVIRAATGIDEQHDIYLASARMTPEGVFLSLGRAFNLSQTTLVDEAPPVGMGSVFAFVENQGDDAPSSVRMVDLAGHGDDATWSRLERVQAAIARLQATGRADGVRIIKYSVQPAPNTLEVAVFGQHGRAAQLRIDADAQSANISVDAPLEAPSWLTVETLPARRPGNLVTWAVDRVRNEIGDTAMQYIKAIAFTFKDIFESQAEELSGDTGEDDIADDLGQDSLAPIDRSIPVDPEIGFPPPPLETWVKEIVARRRRLATQRQQPVHPSAARFAAHVRDDFHSQRPAAQDDPRLHRAVGSARGSAEHDGWPGRAQERDGRHRSWALAARADRAASRGPPP